MSRSYNVSGENYDEDVTFGKRTEAFPRLVLKSDGQVLTGDGLSEPTALGGGSTITHKQKRRTAGAVVHSTTLWTAIDTALDISLAAVAGDTIEVGFGVLVITANTESYVDAHTIVGTVPTNSVGFGGAVPSDGVGAVPWRTGANRSGGAQVGGSMFYTVVAGDLSLGSITLRLFTRGNVTAQNRTYRAGGGTQATGEENMIFWAKNLGPATP